AEDGRGTRAEFVGRGCATSTEWGCASIMKLTGLIRGIAIGLAAGVGAVLSLKLAVDNGVFMAFRGGLWLPGHVMRQGLSPYPGAHDVLSGTPSIYTPPFILVAGVPLSILPFYLAAVIWAGLLTIFSAAVLYLMRVRDPR